MANSLFVFKLCLAALTALAVLHVTNANTLDIQAEYLMGYPLANLRQRSNAVNAKTVWLKDFEHSVSWMLCTEVQLDLQVLAIRYSMDAWEKTIAITLDSVDIGTFNAENSSDEGFNWNTFVNTSTPLTSRQVVAPGLHVLSLTIKALSWERDVYGLEIDQITVDFRQNVTMQHLLCSK